MTRDRLRDRTDAGSWERGVGYHQRGRVLELAVDGQTVIARVMGTHRYKVELWAGEGKMFGDCTCPMGDRGVFCKHCVATGLQCIEEGITQLGEDGHEPEEPDHGTGGTDRNVTDIDDIREYLRGVDTEDLIEIVVEQAKSDESLMRRLKTEVAESRGLGPDVDTFKSAISNATFATDFVDWDNAWEFASGIDEVVGEIAELLEEGYAEEVVELCEYAIEEVESAFGYVDDSGGSLGMTRDRLQELHRQACRSADLDRERLAEWLFFYELTSDYGSLSGAVKMYAGVLGEEGLAEYRRLAEEKWEDYPRLGPGEERARGTNRYTMERIMESLAEVSGDLEELVGVEKRDLSSSYRYLKIAEVYKENRQYNEAMEWAEKGLEAFPENEDSRLRSFLATEYSRRSRHEEATELAWENFTESPGWETYSELKKHAEKAGAWSEWRKRAISRVEEKGERERQQDSRLADRWRRTRSGETLVEIYLGERAIETAWKAARRYGCTRHQWLSLARRREEEHPRDAIEVYQCEVAHQAERTKNEAYREAMKRVRRIRKLMERMGEKEEFDRYIDSLRKEYKRKRNFMGMLDGLE